MQKFINSVKQSLENKNWYSALIVTLTLPDIAGKVIALVKSLDGLDIVHGSINIY